MHAKQVDIINYQNEHVFVSFRGLHAPSFTTLRNKIKENRLSRWTCLEIKSHLYNLNQELKTIFFFVEYKPKESKATKVKLKKIHTHEFNWRVN
jgi:hypothetical protein